MVKNFIKVDQAMDSYLKQHNYENIQALIFEIINKNEVLSLIEDKNEYIKKLLIERHDKETLFSEILLYTKIKDIVEYTEYAKLLNLYITNLKTSDEKLSALHLAVLLDDVKILESILEYTDINQIDINNRTPLCIAINYEKIGIIEFLLNKGADVNCLIGENKDIDLLSFVVKYESIEIARILADYDQKIAVFANNYNMKNVLITILEYTSADDIDKMLLKHEAELKQFDENINAKKQLSSILKYIFQDIAELLLDHGIKINQFIESDNIIDPLVFAIKDQNNEMIELLSKHGAKLNDKIIDLAKFFANQEITELLYCMSKIDSNPVTLNIAVKSETANELDNTNTMLGEDGDIYIEF